MNRTSMIIVVCLGLALLLSVGGAYWWWTSNSGALMEQAKQAYTDGTKMGASLDENGCLAAATERQKTKSNQTFIETTRTGVTLAACLSASKVSDGFCDGVPSPKNPIDSATWAARVCLKSGATDSSCQSLMQHVTHHCASPERLTKARKAAAAAKD
jgi:hypothetical protein